MRTWTKTPREHGSQSLAPDAIGGPSQLESPASDLAQQQSTANGLPYCKTQPVALPNSGAQSLSPPEQRVQTEALSESEALSEAPPKHGVQPDA